MKKAAALAVLVLASVALVACGGSSDNSTTASGGESESAGGGATPPPAEGGGGGSSIVQLAAASGTDLAYTTDAASAEAGQVSIEFENPQELQHDVAVEDSGGEVLGETELVAGGTATTTIDLKPGSYTFFCTVPGHREAGMEGTLTVK